MKPELGIRYSPSFNGAVAHSSREDFNIWQRWWPNHRTGVVALYFDVALGEGRPIPPFTPPNLARMWLRLNRKRADIVLEHEKTYTIIELRDIASSSAVGRLLTYLRLWRVDPPDAKPISGLLITNELDQEVKDTALESQLRYEVA